MKKSTRDKILGILVIILGLLNCLFVILYNNLSMQDIFKLLITVIFLPLGTYFILTKGKL